MYRRRRIVSVVLGSLFFLISGNIREYARYVPRCRICIDGFNHTILNFWILDSPQRDDVPKSRRARLSSREECLSQIIIFESILQNRSLLYECTWEPSFNGTWKYSTILSMQSISNRVKFSIYTRVNLFYTINQMYINIVFVFETACR